MPCPADTACIPDCRTGASFRETNEIEDRGIDIGKLVVVPRSSPDSDIRTTLREEFAHLRAGLLVDMHRAQKEIAFLREAVVADVRGILAETTSHRDSLMRTARNLLMDSWIEQFNCCKDNLLTEVHTMAKDVHHQQAQLVDRQEVVLEGLLQLGTNCSTVGGSLTEYSGCVKAAKCRASESNVALLNSTNQPCLEDSQPSTEDMLGTWVYDSMSARSVYKVSRSDAGELNFTESFPNGNSNQGKLWSDGPVLLQGEILDQHGVLQGSVRLRLCTVSGKLISNYRGVGADGTDWGPNVHASRLLSPHEDDVSKTGCRYHHGELGKADCRHHGMDCEDRSRVCEEKHNSFGENAVHKGAPDTFFSSASSVETAIDASHEPANKVSESDPPVKRPSTCSGTRKESKLSRTSRPSCNSSTGRHSRNSSKTALTDGSGDMYRVGSMDANMGISEGTPAFVVLPVWAKRQNMASGRESFFGGRDSRESRDSPDGDSESRGRKSQNSEPLPEQCTVFASSSIVWQKIMIAPNANVRSLWDIGSMILVLYEMIQLPMLFMIDDDFYSPFLIGMDWLTRIYWTADMPFSCCSGFIAKDGTIDMRPSSVVGKYLKGWFALDCVIVGSDWLECIVTESSGISLTAIGTVGRVFRMLRMLRLLRLAKANEIIKLITERLPSEKLVVCLDITKLMLIMLGFCHFIACFWYAVGVSDVDKPNWVENKGYDDFGLDYKYIMSYRWALSQFAGGMDEVIPSNLNEHMYSAWVFVAAFWSGNAIVSIMTSHMTQMYILGNQQTQQLTVMRRYLAQNGVSKGLSLRVIRNAQHTMKIRSDSTPEELVGLTEFVSTPLRTELHFEMYSPMLTHHPWFANYLELCPIVVHKICHMAMSSITMAEGDIIFHFGEEATSMMFVKTGFLKYFYGDGEEVILRRGNWISEAPLWISWIHRGELKALDNTTIFNLDAALFQDIVSKFQLANADPRYYARSFAVTLNNTDEEVTDLPLKNSGGWRDDLPPGGGARKPSK